MSASLHALVVVLGILAGCKGNPSRRSCSEEAEKPCWPELKDILDQLKTVLHSNPFIEKLVKEFYEDTFFNNHKQSLNKSTEDIACLLEGVHNLADVSMLLPHMSRYGLERRYKSLNQTWSNLGGIQGLQSFTSAFDDLLQLAIEIKFPHVPVRVMTGQELEARLIPITDRAMHSVLVIEPHFDIDFVMLAEALAGSPNATSFERSMGLGPGDMFILYQIGASLPDLRVLVQLAFQAAQEFHSHGWLDWDPYADSCWPALEQPLRRLRELIEGSESDYNLPLRSFSMLSALLRHRINSTESLTQAICIMAGIQTVGDLANVLPVSEQRLTQEINRTKEMLQAIGGLEGIQAIRTGLEQLSRFWQNIGISNLPMKWMNRDELKQFWLSSSRTIRESDQFQKALEMQGISVPIFPTDQLVDGILESHSLLELSEHLGVDESSLLPLASMRNLIDANAGLRLYFEVIQELISNHWLGL